MKDILFDPQTSGGLLVTCSKEESSKIIEELSKLELPSAIIGEVVTKQEENYIVVE